MLSHIRLCGSGGTHQPAWRPVQPAQVQPVHTALSQRSVESRRTPRPLVASILSRHRPTLPGATLPPLLDPDPAAAASSSRPSLVRPRPRAPPACCCRSRPSRRQNPQAPTSGPCRFPPRGRTRSFRPRVFRFPSVPCLPRNPPATTASAPVSPGRSSSKLQRGVPPVLFFPGQGPQFSFFSPVPSPAGVLLARLLFASSDAGPSGHLIQSIPAARDLQDFALPLGDFLLPIRLAGPTPAASLPALGPRAPARLTGGVFRNIRFRPAPAEHPARRVVPSKPVTKNAAAAGFPDGVSGRKPPGPAQPFRFGRTLRPSRRPFIHSGPARPPAPRVAGGRKGPAASGAPVPMMLKGTPGGRVAWPGPRQALNRSPAARSYVQAPRPRTGPTVHPPTPTG